MSYWKGFMRTYTWWLHNTFHMLHKLFHINILHKLTIALLFFAKIFTLFILIITQNNSRRLADHSHKKRPKMSLSFFFSSKLANLKAFSSSHITFSSNLIFIIIFPFQYLIRGQLLWSSSVNTSSFNFSFYVKDGTV